MWFCNKELRILFVVSLAWHVPLIWAYPCPFVDYINEECVEMFDCTPGGNSLSIYEDCLINEILFVVNDTSQVQNDLTACPFLKLNGNEFLLEQGQNAEAKPNPLGPCKITTDGTSTFIPILDINEADPQPVDGNRVQEVNVDENLPAHDVASFKYTDEDEGETGDLEFTLLTEGLDDTFITSQEFLGGEMIFTIRVLRELDYEDRMFYKLEYNITSTDSRGTERTSKHTVFFYVNDIGDNPPYWLQTFPTFSFIEGPAGREVFQVIAEDRDLDIDNVIKYEITNGNAELFFDIDPETGMVTIVREIDRERDTTFFILEITAQEYFENGTIAPSPSNSSTLTNLNIADDNDNTPSFSKSTYEIEMNEVADFDVSMPFDIFVFDMDLGDNGTYTIESDYPNDIRIVPAEAFGNVTLQLTALSSGTIFDYEATQEVTVTLTTTEKADPSHISTATLIVTLNDDNDHVPQFQQSVYTVQVEENVQKGHSLVNISATDDDLSDNFGNASLRYDTSCEFLDTDEITGEVTLGQSNYLDFETEPEIFCELYVNDNEGNAPSERGLAQLNITVLDVVDSPPVLAVTPGSIEENSPEDAIVGDDILAWDTDIGANIEFFIDLGSSTAQKDGEEVNINNIVDWFKIGDIGKNGQNYTATVKTGPVEIDREIVDTVFLSVVVRDLNTITGSDKDTAIFEITIIDQKDTPPILLPDFSLNVEENSVGGTTIGILQSSDGDVDDSVTFTIDDNSLVYVEKVAENEFWIYLRVNESAEIDREEQDSITVNITVTDSVGLSTWRQYLIAVIDVNDNPPNFNEDVILATFTESDSADKTVKIFEARDQDLNEVLTYSLLDDFEWHEGGPEPQPLTPFLIKTENNVASLILNFNPVGINSGYCNFTIVCQDKDNVHTSTVEGKVFAITIAYQISVLFANDLTDVQSQRSEIESIFSDVYEYECNINSISEETRRSSEAIKAGPETVVIMHFIDEAKNEPVDAEIIIETTNDQEVAQELLERMSARGLHLESVGNNVVDTQGSTNKQVLLLQILLAVVSLVLGSLLLLLLITYFVRTRKLGRQLRVAKATSFGTLSSSLNQTEMTAVPGCNKFAGEGANPMYNVEDTELRNDDNSSTSGDSVLVGVEENPDFREYREPAEESRGTYKSSSDHGSTVRSIDDVSGPSPFEGGSRTNPLMAAHFDDNDVDLDEAMRNYDRFILRKSDGSEGSFGGNDLVKRSKPRVHRG